MKKLLISLLAIVGMTLGANARDMNLTASYGGYTAMDASDYHDGWHHVNNAWGAFNVGFNVKVLPKFWIGPSYTLSTTTCSILFQHTYAKRCDNVRPPRRRRRNITHAAL